MLKLDQKQKWILVLTVAAFIFLGWQVYSLIKDDVSSHISKASPKAPVLTNSASVADKTAVVSERSSSAQSTAAPSAPSLQNLPRVQEELPKKMLRSIEFPGHSEYVELANAYELAKMRHQLLVEQVAIADAEQKIAKMNHEVGPAPTAGPRVLRSSSESDGSYHLVSVAQSSGVWSATLVRNGRYQTVKVGAHLVPDIKVLAIDDEGVLIQQDSKEKRMGFDD